MADDPQPTSLWATYSIRDHLNPNRFIADALIYDHLVMPVPVRGEEEVWIESKGDLKLQNTPVETIKAADANEELLLGIPWNSERRRQFRTIFGGDRGMPELNDPGAVNALAHDLQGMKAERSKDAAFHATAGLLAMLVGGNADDPIFQAFYARVAHDAGTPEPVLAYHRFEQLRRSIGVGALAERHERMAEIAYESLNWEVQVPKPRGDELDAEKLKAAVKLAVDPDWRSERAAFNRWITAVADAAIGVATSVAAEGLSLTVKHFLPIPEVRPRLHPAA